MNNPAWLLQYAKNIHSQYGEDGIIEKILELIPYKNRFCVEFGAWDGIHYSNTRHLIEQGYSAILIEPDINKYQLLLNNNSGNDKIECINLPVGNTKNDGLDAILGALPYIVPEFFDLLSIDIDGNDYLVWEAVKNFHPKIVIIEFNPSMPTEILHIQPPDESMHTGSSLMSLYQLAKSKQYSLAAVTTTNAIFIDNIYFPLLNISNDHPVYMRRDCSLVTWMFTGYDGSIYTAGAQILPWHNVQFNGNNMQILPRCLRKFPENYGIVQRLLWRVWAIYKNIKYWIGA